MKEWLQPVADLVEGTAVWTNTAPDSATGVATLIIAFIVFVIFLLFMWFILRKVRR